MVRLLLLQTALDVNHAAHLRQSIKRPDKLITVTTSPSFTTINATDPGKGLVCSLKSAHNDAFKCYVLLLGVNDTKIPPSGKIPIMRLRISSACS